MTDQNLEHGAPLSCNDRTCVQVRQFIQLYEGSSTPFRPKVASGNSHKLQYKTPSHVEQDSMEGHLASILKHCAQLLQCPACPTVRLSAGTRGRSGTRVL